MWWSGLVGTPIGGVEDDPELCAEIEAAAIWAGDASLARGARSFPDARHLAAQRGVLSRAFRRAVTRPRRLPRDVLSGVQRSVERWCGSSTSSRRRWSRPLPLHSSVTAAARGPIAIVTTITRAGPSATWRSETRSRPARECHPTNPGRRHSEITAIAPRARIHACSLPGIRFLRSFYACSGARAPDVLSRSRYGEVPQVDHPRLRRAQLVTISIGGTTPGS